MGVECGDGQGGDEFIKPQICGSYSCGYWACFVEKLTAYVKL